MRYSYSRVYGSLSLLNAEDVLDLLVTSYCSLLDGQLRDNRRAHLRLWADRRLGLWISREIWHSQYCVGEGAQYNH